MASSSGRPPGGSKVARAPDGGSAAPTRPAVKVTPVPVPKPGSMPSFPSAVSQLGPAARPPSNNGSIPTSAPLAGFGLLAPAESSLQDSSSGSHRDGRIRNPVPSKLKGKTDGSKGNFGVMHMEVIGRGEATERDAQAKRTSESTELAAKRAFENGYVSLRRSRFIHLPDEVVDKPFIPAPTAAPASTSHVRRSPLDADETKSEQARLLTLLRSLHPVLVVDQICKALAFFGGIPGAPPPTDGAFPQSAEANGSGGLFVGWLAEIFPKLGRNPGQRALSPARQLDISESVKRRRGRPKGSKATKTRKDKGIPKARPQVASGVGQLRSAEADDSWVDIDETALGVHDEVDANVMLLAQATSPRQQEASPEAAVRGRSSPEVGAPTRTALPGGLAGDDSTTISTSSPRKRGRPKGSKNRPKDSSSALFDSLGSVLQPALAPPAPQVPQAPPGPTANLSFTAVNSAASTLVKKRASKPKGAGNKQRPEEQPVESSGAQRSNDMELTDPSAQAKPTSASDSRFTQHQAYQIPQTFQPPPEHRVQTPSTTGTSLAKPTGTVGQKRKRKGGKDIESLQSGSQGQSNGPTRSPRGSGLTTSSSPHIPVSQPPAPISMIAPPPAKRQRKGKDPKPSPRRQNESLATNSAGTASPMPATIPPPNSTLEPAVNPITVPTPVPVRGSEPAQAPAPISAESTISSVHSPHHGHFEVQSPTMENYEAQLQAQLEQQTEPESQPVATRSLVGHSRLVSNRLQQAPQQASTAQSRSPNPQTQQPIKPQTASPMVKQTRTPQTPYSPYRPPNAHYGQHQQNYGSSQPQQGQQPQFAGQEQPGQASAQAAQAPHYSPSTQQPYPATQYSSGQQQLASQQRYQQQLGTSSTGSASYTAQHSPQFGSSASNTFSSTDGNYRGSATSLSTISYGSQRSQSGTPTTVTPFRTGNVGNGHGVTHHLPSFGSSTNTIQQRPVGAAHPSGQGMQGMAGVQSFSGNSATDWGLFDASSLDGSGSQSTLGLTSAGYNMSPANARASSNSGAGFTTNSLANFDTSALGGTDRFYGVGRR